MDHVMSVFAGHLAALRSGAQEWWSGAPLAEFGEPAGAILLCLALLSGIVSKNLFVLLGTGTWATLGVYLASRQAPEVELFWSLRDWCGLLRFEACRTGPDVVSAGGASAA